MTVLRGTWRVATRAQRRGAGRGPEEAFREVVVRDPGAAGLEDALNDPVRTTLRFGLLDRVLEEYEGHERS